MAGSAHGAGIAVGVVSASTAVSVRSARTAAGAGSASMAVKIAFFLSSYFTAVACDA